MNALVDWPEWLAAEAQTSRVRHAESSTRSSADVEAPSVEAVVELLDAMPNDPDNDRDVYLRVMMAARGCGDDPLIAAAAVRWAARWIGTPGEDVEAEKWERDFALRDAPLAGWANLLAAAARFGVDVAKYRALTPSEFPAVKPIIATSPARVLISRPFAWRSPSSIPPREWVYGGHYIKKFVSATVAPGGLGKSSHALVEALEMVTGKPLLRGKVGPQRRVAYWNGEDPLEETERRVAAICLRYGIACEDIGDRLYIQSGRESPLILASEDRDGVCVAKPVTARVIAEARSACLDVLIIDPFVKAHAISENDNSKVDAVATQFAEIADAANISVELIHHLRKASGQDQDRTADDARGASALVSAARSVRVLNPMQKADAESLGIPEDRRRRYFRVDDGKANLMPPTDRATWRHLASVSLGNSRPGLAADDVGVAEPWEKPEIADLVGPEHMREIRSRIESGAPCRRDVRSPDWAGVWFGDVLGIDANASGAKKRLTKIIDMLITQGSLSARSEPNGKGRAVEVLFMPSHSPTV